jgi:3-hydroxyisobutyrate dehydrogenase-like beta-hydroxyacid dehydrogenase
MLRGNFSPKGPTGIANKDMGLILETAKKLGVVLPVGGLYQQLMLKALYNGWGLLDATVVMKIYQQLAEVAGEKRKPVRKKK